VLLQALQAPIGSTAIRDTISRIVLERGYQRSLTSTLFSRLWNWFWDFVTGLFREAVASRGTYLITIALLSLLAVASIVRAIIVARARRTAANRRQLPETADEKLAAARALAAQGAYVEAAHRLYAAVVTRLAEERRVRWHTSKTVGDYWRELRAASDERTGAYQSFARTYEIVAYGDGLCDATRYARLEQLAEPMVRPGAVPATSRAA
jgi:Domain of unknown function (DUF4129)